ncbi:MAG: SDR family oxidoreductase [Acidobacteriia bacterium]|nr:SDR family oxidoreductase [Terriglobia bacterium]
MIRLDGKVAMITGAGSGIGQGVAVLFARAGADLALLDLREEGLAETERRLDGSARQRLPLQTDLADTAAARAAVSRAVEEYGRIDILVNCAGIAVVKPFLEVSEDEYDRVMRTNIRGMYFLSQAVARAMVEAGTCGRIVHIGSTAGESPFPQASVYAVSKGGVRQLTRAMSIELAGHGITVNCIAPGHCDTPLSRSHIPSEEVRRQMIAGIPVGRMGQPADVAWLALYLASDQASFANGEIFILDGGNLAVGR